ncbi:MAG: bifunctional 4-hydroxy-2-oxoglutarate aldolase/2-dehydro-3-deoxy-phosphogluconate aldolase [Clostridia bacterium]|nr:bifunctional 4-hydroxy-2-oxoglutarate aldolase/2-dehydro-3-deoxy-phosphogluconate aldolase [Clostridia bacterium]
MDIFENMYKTGFVPVVVINNADNAVKTAEALLKGGIDFMEITFRTECAKEAISSVSKNVKNMIVGAGTVINLNQAKEAVEAGAKFIVSPGLSEEVVEWCIENDIPVLPGCVTPTEIMKAVSMGLKNIKFFPANIYGGLSAIKALSAPFGGIKFLPTGGVSEQNLSDFISNPKILAAGGSFVCAAKDIDEGNYDAIAESAARVTDIVRKIRN